MEDLHVPPCTMPNLGFPTISLANVRLAPEYYVGHWKRLG